MHVNGFLSQFCSGDDLIVSNLAFAPAVSRPLCRPFIGYMVFDNCVSRSSLCSDRFVLWSFGCLGSE